MNLPVKTGLLLLLLSAWTCRGVAQHHLGVRAGYGGGSARIDYSSTWFNGSRESRFLFGYPSAGISWKYYSPQLVVGGLQADLQMIKKGYREMWGKRMENDVEVFDSTYRRTISAIELPLMWQPHVYLFKQRVRAYVNLGIYVSYMYDSHEKAEKQDGTMVYDRPYEISSLTDNRFEFGLCGGVGVSVLFSRFEAFAEARYSFGYSDLIRSRAKYPGSIYNRTPVDMLNVSVGVYYRLGKGGILSLEAPRKRIRKERWEDMPSGPPNRGGSASGSSTSGSPSGTGRSGQRTITAPTTPDR